MKKQIHRSLLWLLLLAPPLFWLGCKKDPEPEIIKGHVREYGTNKPIPDAKVNLSVCDGEFGGPISCGLAASTLTDANGYYSFPPHGGVRIANAVKDGYFTDLDSEIVIVDVPENDITLFPHAYLKVIVKNESGFYGIKSQALETQGVLHQLQGQQDTLYTIVKGNKNYSLHFGLYKTEDGGSLNGHMPTVFLGKTNPIQVPVTSSFYFDFTPVGHDTTYLTITY